MRKRLLVTYIILVHAILIWMLVTSDFLSRLCPRSSSTTTEAPEITQFYSSMVIYHERMDKNVPDDAAVFIGDSHIQALCTDAVVTPSVNFGIGSDSTVGVLNRLPKYRCLERASVAVLAIGINDLKRRDDAAILANHKNILRSIPPNLPVVISALFPLGATATSEPQFTNGRIRQLNRAVQALCATDPRCEFVDVGAKLVDQTGNLRDAFQDGDGIHLNSDGYRLWIEALRTAISKVQKTPLAPPP